MLRNIFKILVIFIIGMVGGIFADQILWPYFIERPLFYQYRLEQSPVYLTERKEIYIQENIALKNAIERVEKVVIGIRTKTKAGKILEGSGLILTADGLMVTLAELVPVGSAFNFFIDGERIPFQILKRDLENNLALIKLEKNNLPTVGFANLEKLKLGERVFLVGATFINVTRQDLVTPDLQKVVNEGIVTSFDQNSIKTNIFEKNVLAGSPLFDIEGKLLGLNMIDKEGKIITIPISQIRAFANL
ncbi:MAG: serine protease [Patescibacteria group bacterium]|nr:serine protease [Patescibacteria group bacterium]